MENAPRARREHINIRRRKYKKHGHRIKQNEMDIGILQILLSILIRQTPISYFFGNILIVWFTFLIIFRNRSRRNNSIQRGYYGGYRGYKLMLCIQFQKNEYDNQ